MFWSHFSTDVSYQERYTSPGNLTHQPLYLLTKTGYAFFYSITDEGVAPDNGDLLINGI